VNPCTQSFDISSIASSSAFCIGYCSSFSTCLKLELMAEFTASPEEQSKLKTMSTQHQYCESHKLPFLLHATYFIRNEWILALCPCEIRGFHGGEDSSQANISENLSASISISSWRWRQQVPTKCLYPTANLYGVIIQKSSTWWHYTEG